MPPLETAGLAFAKYAPMLFCTVTPKGIRPNMYQIAHTLIVSAIVAGSAYGAVRSEIGQLTKLYEAQDKRIAVAEDKISEVSLIQAKAIGKADEIHRNIVERIDRAERVERRK